MAGSGPGGWPPGAGNWYDKQKERRDKFLAEHPEWSIVYVRSMDRHEASAGDHDSGLDLLTDRSLGALMDRLLARYRADAAVAGLMASRTAWWLDRWLVPGDDNSAELDRVNLELRELPGRGLDEDAEDEQRAALRAERRRLEALGSTPARTETGFRRDADGSLLSAGDHWRSLDGNGRRAWMTSGEFRLLAKAAPGRSGAVAVELAFPPENDE